MSYTFIVLRTDRTDKGSKTVTLPKPVVWLLILGALSAPFATYFYTFYQAAPEYWSPMAKVLQSDLDQLQIEYEKVLYENEALTAQNDLLNEQAVGDRRSKSELEAVVNIAETARATSSKQILDLEGQILELERKLAMYEEFIKPDTDKEILQCFNISIKKAGKKLSYGINFLKTDQKDRSTLNTRVRFSVLTGTDILNLKEDGIEDATREVSMSLVKDRRLNGSLNVNDLKDGLHVLDIKAYDKDENVIAHCWKAF